jgi:hypothetical protein
MCYSPCCQPKPAFAAGCYPVFVMMPQFQQVQPREIDVDATTTSKTAVTGGTSDARLTVEYYVDTGASSPSVTLTMVSSGTTTTWTDTAIAAGYHVHQQLPAVPPGTKLTLAASNALARVRWCETFCC